MLKYYNVDVVFSEVPDEVTLAVNITGCPNRCPGCHSPLMWEDCGQELGPQQMDALMERYAQGVTCVCFMGGDAEPRTVFSLARRVKQRHPGIRLAWYSGRQELAGGFPYGVFDYVKVGPYVEAAGPLTSPGTNQRFYRVGGDGTLEDITVRFHKGKK